VEECRGVPVRFSRRRGQIRIMEAVLATFMVVAIILLVMSFTRPLRSPYIRETTDLRRLAYNLLSYMAENNVFELTLSRISASTGSTPNQCIFYDLGFLATASLPPETLYKLDIYNVTYDNLSGNLNLTWLGCASNYNWSSIGLVESESVTYTYVCTGGPDKIRGNIIYIRLTIGFSG
jgi:hypothetical protein